MGTFVHEHVREGKWVPPWLRMQNVARYEWVSQFASGCRVLEVGCGSGQGTRMVADAGAAEVMGVDVSEASIAHARSNVATDRLTFRTVAGKSLPLPDAAYDMVVSLETIEHVADDDRFLEEIARVLRPDGRFFCSTPNRTVTNPGTRVTDRPFNPNHVREYTRGELQALLWLYFGKVQLLGQSPYGRNYVALLGFVGRILPRAAVRMHQARKLLTMAFDQPDRHRPAEISARWEPEVLVATCRSPIVRRES